LGSDTLGASVDRFPAAMVQPVLPWREDTDSDKGEVSCPDGGTIPIDDGGIRLKIS